MGDDEPLLTLAEAGAIVRAEPASLSRWILRGKGGIKLEGVKLGRQLFTSKKALLRFGERCKGAVVAEAPEVDPKRARAAMARYAALTRSSR